MKYFHSIEIINNTSIISNILKLFSSIYNKYQCYSSVVQNTQYINTVKYT